MNNRKEAICNALAAFIRQRPGLDPRNYISHGADDAGRRAYFSEQRAIARDKRDAETLLLAVRHNDGISADYILEAARSAYSGRLTLTLETRERMPAATSAGGNYADRPYTETLCKIDYCTGQYFPTEYRRAVAAVCASALWSWQREHMPSRAKLVIGDESKTHTRQEGYELGGKIVSAGDWLRRKFRQDFGSAIQKRWFD